MIKQHLAGKRIAITGSTGFLGTALVELLLREIPDVELVLLIRSARRSAARRIQRDILHNDAFSTLRSTIGKEKFDSLTENQIVPVAADISKDDLGLDSDGLAILQTCDIVIHSAAAVSFDEPLDRAVEVNLMGPVRLVETLKNLDITPHLVMVSTCYVAGSRKGDAPELALSDSPFYVPVDWNDETNAARRTRSYVEDASRRPNNLKGFRESAISELGAAGTPAIASKTETLRQRWVKDQMVDAGRNRASSLGFPDAYTFTKAMAEQAVEETRDRIPLTIVRPSIIESSLQHPFSGWIRGFRMAEPIILNFGRGTLKEFPGIPEGIMDIIPVDLVASAIVAAAAQETSEETTIYQVASGSCNPIRISTITDYVHNFFGENPIYDEKNQPIAPAKWKFPGRGRVVSQLNRANYLLNYAEQILHKLPIRGRSAMLVADIQERKEEIDKAMEYVTLYGKYVECEALYSVSNLITLWDSLSEEDHRTFPFDPRAIDWFDYIYNTHLPTVIAKGRVKTSPAKSTGASRTTRLRTQVLDPKRELAVFDLENTLIASNVVSSWTYLATKRLPAAERFKLVSRTLAQAPSLLALDRKDRTDFLRSFYRRYANAPIEQIDKDAFEMFSELILAKSFPAALLRVREHKAIGHRTLLITGALDFVVKPLQPLFDDIISATLSHNGNSYTGQMQQVPPIGETRAAVLRRYAKTHSYDLTESIAYADSTSDLPMLEAVGFPVAVNPEPKLAALARRRGWLIENFQAASGSPSKMLPIGSRKRN
ncbi:MAG: HAD-IB family hydrolase [Acidimicrobiales bacterium]|nr:HAD-IB family hydrolase [Acidimicrobiales bacterium]